MEEADEFLQGIQVAGRAGRDVVWVEFWMLPGGRFADADRAAPIELTIRDGKRVCGRAEGAKGFGELGIDVVLEEGDLRTGFSASVKRSPRGTSATIRRSSDWVLIMVGTV